jgi:polyisoprenoid-binding protein YceI
VRCIRTGRGLDPNHTYPSLEVNHLGFSVMRGSITATTGSLVYAQEQRTGRVAFKVTGLVTPSYQ